MNTLIRTVGILIFISFLPGIMSGQVDFTEVTTISEMNEAKKLANEQKLFLFVDVYANWCGPCKAMDREVYTDPAVSTYLNSNFVNVRMDGETDYGRMFAAQNGLEGYPSMFIFNSEGDYVSKIVGFTQAEMLVESARGIVDNYSTVANYRRLSEIRELESDEMAAYVNAVRQMGTDGEAELLAKSYMENISEKKLSDDDILVIAYYLTLDNKFWDEFSSDPDRLRRVLKDNYMLAMEKIYNNTLVKAVDEDNLLLISMMANDLAPLVEERETNSWDLRSLPFLQYYYYTGKIDELISYIDRRFASDRKGDHRWLYGAASQVVDMDQKYQTEELMAKGTEWFRECIDLDENFDYYFYLGMTLFFTDEQDESKSSFVKAKALASNEEQMNMVSQVLQYFENR